MDVLGIVKKNKFSNDEFTDNVKLSKFRKLL